MRKRRVEINIERTRVFVKGGLSSPTRVLCETCGGQARMVTVDEAAAAVGLTRAAISYRIKAGEVHFRRAPEGLLLVCLNSVLET
jgi:hypothetical protein